MSPGGKKCLGEASGEGIQPTNHKRDVPAAGSTHKETGFRETQDAENARRGVWESTSTKSITLNESELDFTSEPEPCSSSPRAVETHPIKLYDSEQAASLRLASRITGGLFVLLVMGLVAITAIILTGATASQVIDYFKIIIGPVFSLAMFIAGYAVRGRSSGKS
jgi:hypothetical protein